MPEREFNKEYPYDTPIEQVKYIGPYLADRLANSSYFGTPKPILTLGDLRTLVMTRTGPNAPARIKQYLEETLENRRPENCVGAIRKPYQTYDNVDHQYSVRTTNRNAFDALVIWLRANVPSAHKFKVPVTKRDRTSRNAFPANCAL